MARSIDRFNPQTELDTLQHRFFGDDFFTSFRGATLPTTDVYTEGDERLVVEVHLPNFNENDISISVDDGALIVQAERRERAEDSNKKFMVRESSSSFYRRITLTERADEGHIRADFANGVLKVVVPFRELPSPKRIAINSGRTDGNSEGETAGAVEGSRTEASGSSS